MKSNRIAGFLAVLACAGIVLGPIRAHAGTKYQTSLVPDVALLTPGFSANGSSIQLNGKLALKGKIKGVVDVNGDRITATNYSVEVDLSIPATATTETVTVSFDLTNGNGKFSADLSADPGLSAAAVGNGVAVLAVRVKDDAAAVIGHGGFAKE